MQLGRTLLTDWWKAVIPRGWEGYFDEIATFEPRDIRDSTLRIACTRRVAGVVHDDELRRHIAKLCPAPRTWPIAVALTDLKGYVCDVVGAKDRTFWRYWVLRNGQHLFKVIYNCHRDVQTRDDSICEEVLKSIVLRQP